MTAAHLIYIPLVALTGMMLGFIFGGRAARDRQNLERQRELEREAARAARAERRARKAAQSGDKSDA